MPGTSSGQLLVVLSLALLAHHAAYAALCWGELEQDVIYAQASDPFTCHESVQQAKDACFGQMNIGGTCRALTRSECGWTPRTADDRRTVPGTGVDSYALRECPPPASLGLCWTGPFEDSHCVAFASPYDCDPDLRPAMDKCLRNAEAGENCRAVSHTDKGWCSRKDCENLLQVPNRDTWKLEPCPPSPPTPPPPPEKLCGEEPIPTTPVLCQATTDVMLVVDGSASVRDTHAEMSNFMNAFTRKFALEKALPDESPKIGIVTFNGPEEQWNLEDFAEDDAAQVLVGLTPDLDLIKRTIDERPMSTGSTRYELWHPQSPQPPAGEPPAARGGYSCADDRRPADRRRQRQRRHPVCELPQERRVHCRHHRLRQRRP